LNVRHGPNLEKVVREVEFRNDQEAQIEFDLAYTRINDSKITDMWVDIIFENPAMNQITLRDLVVSRHPRSEI